MKKLFEKSVILGPQSHYFGIYSYADHTFKITSTLVNGLSVWRIDVRTKTGKWTFETGNLIFENTTASYTLNDVNTNIEMSFDAGIDIATDYIKAVYVEKPQQLYKNINKSDN